MESRCASQRRPHQSNVVVPAVPASPQPHARARAVAQRMAREHALPQGGRTLELTSPRAANDAGTPASP
eukprot:5616343-Pyramimonas_sp.AAC.1